MKCNSANIEKDVQRTDRNHEFFEGDENQNLIMMKDILMTYNMYNFDLGEFKFLVYLFANNFVQLI